MRTGRPLLAAAAVAIAATTAAYTFGGPGAQAAAPTTKAKPAAKPAEKCVADARYPKRQLRGVWIATVKNIDWPSATGLSPAKQRAEYVKILDNAVRRNLNAVFVQVRPASDALYKSPYEPWSQYLTGTPGKDPGWDPLPFLTAEAHKRGLEFHAWFNPYRAAYDANLRRLPAAHPARQHPDWLVKYGEQYYYNPGLPQVRDHVVKVVTDVVKRYDVDGIHFDDYFYPYPGGGSTFNDRAAFRKYGDGAKLADWRRANVNTLVGQVHKAVHDTKKDVKFGISPFGIWRNKAQDPTGSATAGMSAYDSIYADARAWIKSGTVDYVMPQLYWPRGFKAADYKVLAPWWANEVKGTDVRLYIGQGLYRVGATDVPTWTKPGELPAHLTLNSKYADIDGDVYFSAKQLATNPLKVWDRLVKQHYSRPALLPLPEGGAAPAKPAKLKASGSALTWTAVPGARSYAVYKVPGSGKSCQATDARNLIAIVTGSSYTAQAPGTYQVTALDALTRESKPAEATVSAT
ncbi:glycoside hydrolase family 10 protein [Nonomuraea sp. NPDC059194]|uniref:glycoside hydrolase family 10 protein n=1 Tax=Nonomuraea sp. NPDC059194 TaxID=3346764 RepID=UPI00367704D6